MKAIVLAGGFARRLAPITDFVAKPLLPMGGKLVIDWVMDRIEEAGIGDIIVSTNSYYEKQFMYWRRCRGENIKLVIEPTMSEEEKLGAIRGLKYVMDSEGDDEYLVVAGDNLFDFSLSELINFYMKKRETVIAVYDIGDLDKAKRYGVVEIDQDNRVIRMEEKPEKPRTTLISTACYIFPRGTLKRIDEYLSGENNPDSPGYFISWLANNYGIYAYPFRGLWKDIGNIDEYRDAFNLYRNLY